jgi:hypothetical protein
MLNRPTAAHRLMDRRSVLRTGAALAAAGPTLLHGEHAKAQPRPSEWPTMLSEEIGERFVSERHDAGNIDDAEVVDDDNVAALRRLKQALATSLQSREGLPSR